MSYAPVLRSEWIKVRSLPSLGGVLTLLFVVTVGFSLVGSATLGKEEAGEPDFDPLLISFFGVNFGQVVAITFGALAAAAQFKNNAEDLARRGAPPRCLLPRRTGRGRGTHFRRRPGDGTRVFRRWSNAAGRAPDVVDGHGCGPRDPRVCRLSDLDGTVRGGRGNLLRNAAATLGILVPLVLLLSFVLGDVAGSSGVADYLPDRAGRQVLVLDPVGSPGPWAGMAVTAVWAGAAVLAGWCGLRRRDC